MGGPEMAAHTPRRSVAPRESRDAPRIIPPGFSKEATMRRWLVACLSLAMVVAVAGGSAFAQTITWWEHSNPPHNNYSKELVADWNKTHPTMQVEYEFFAMTPYFKKLSASLSTRSAADMFTVIDTLLPSFTTKEVLAPIHPEWLGYKNLDDMKKAYLPGALDGYIHDGKLYAVPMIAATIGTRSEEHTSELQSLAYLV